MSTTETSVDPQVQLAVNQEMIWLGQQLHADAPIFEVPYLYTIRGELDSQALASAFGDLVRTCDIFRIVASDSAWSRPRLVDESPVECEVVDISTEKHPDAAVDELVKRRLEKTFEPTQSLCHATLIRVDKQHWKLFIKLHHVVTDALCGRALLKNLAAFYEARQAIMEAPKPPTYQRSLSQPSVSQRDHDWWSLRSDTVAETRFYRGSAAPGSICHTRVIHSNDTVGELIGQIASRAPFKQITPALSHFNVLSTALAAWLYRLAPSEVVTTGATAHGRSTAEQRNTIGLFMQLLPFRLALEAKDSFETISRKVASESIGFLSHGLPGSMTPESQRPFDVVLNLIDLEVDDFCGLPTSMQWLHNGHGEPKRKLCISAHQRDGKWELLFDFNDDAFNHSERFRVIDHFMQTLRSIACDASQSISGYPLLTESEKLQVRALSASESVRQPDQPPLSLWSKFREAATRSPDAPAIEFGTKHWTYGELLRRADSTAKQIELAGFGPLVPMLCRRDAHAVVAMLGTLAAGRCFLPIDADLPESRTHTLLEQSGSSKLVDATSETFSIDESGIESDFVCPLSESACYVLFTSGSTGLPSGVVVAEDSLLNLLEEFERLGPLKSNVRCGWWTNVGFDVAIYEVFSAILFGRTLHIPSEETRTDASGMIDWLVDHKIESIYLPPYLLRRLSERVSECPPLSLRRLLVGVEPIPQQLLASIARSCSQLSLINGYGPTEATVCATLEQIDPNDPMDGTASIGRAVGGNRLRIIDRDESDVPPGVAGELWIAGAGLARGYLGDPTKTGERFVEREDGRWYRSGDRVRLRDDGKLQFLGRIDDQLKVSGVRIEPGEVAATIRSLDRVSDCIVLPIRRGDQTVGLAACVECQQELDEARLRSELRKRLPRAMVPNRLVILDRLPRTINGKIDRQYLDALLQKKVDPEQGRNASSAKTPSEFVLVELWKDLLDREEIGVEDDYFSLGGSSLDAMTIADRAAKYGLRFTIQDLFRCPTIRELACRLEREPREPMTTRDSSFSSDTPVSTKPVALSARQKTLWYLQQTRPQSFAYHFQLRCTASDQLNADRVRECLDELSMRHATLRTTIEEHNGLPTTRLHAEPMVELGHVESLDAHNALEEGRRSFDFSGSPPWRVLMVDDGKSHELVWTFHHIGFDETSVAILLEDFAALYRGESIEVGAIASVPEQAESDEDLRWWRSHLDEVDLQVELPIDRLESGDSPAGALFRFSIPANLATQLRDLAAVNQISLNNLLLSAYGLLLHTYAGSMCFTIGVPVSQRRGNHRSIGYHIDAFPLAFRVGRDQSFNHLAKEVHGSFSRLLRHSHLSVESLQQEYGALFNVMFVPRTKLPTLALSETLRLHPQITDLGAAKFDWTLFVCGDEESIDCSIEYRSDRFDQTTIERFATHWQNLLRAVVEAPETSLSDQDLRCEEDVRASHALRESSGLIDANEVSNCVSDIFERVATADPNGNAIQHGRETCNYETLDRCASGIAHTLAEDGLPDGEPVVVACERSIVMFAAILGVLKAGGAYVPIDPHTPENRLQSLLRGVGANTILSDGNHFESFANRAGRVIDASVVAPSKETNTRSRHSESLAYILHTSGSTGIPKGVEVTRDAMVRSTVARSSFYDGRPERFLMVSPISFDSSIAGTFWTLCSGGTLVLPEDEDLGDVGRLADLIQRHQVTDTLMLPSLYGLLLRHSDSEKLQSLRRVIVAGESCSNELARLHHQVLPSAKLFNEYGPTEASVWATACELRSDSPVTIGRSVGGVTAYLLGEGGQELPIGAVGEIYLGGERLARGYRGDSELTESRFVLRDGQRLYRTGDRARLRADGSLIYQGRKDQQLKVNGQRVEAAEIESALESIAGIREAVVAIETPSQATINTDDQSLVDALNRLDHAHAARLLGEAAAFGSSQRRPERYDYSDDSFRITIELTSGSLISTPRDRQKKWLIDQALQETAANLHALNGIAEKMVPGNDAPHLPRDLSQEQLSDQEIMEDWQAPLMRSMVDWVAESHGDVLEIGFGRGVAATAIQSVGVRSHTVIEMNPHSIADHFDPWRKRFADRTIQLIEGRWQDNLERLSTYDGVFFHAFPMNEAEFVEYVAHSSTFAEHFFPHAARLLRPHGVFTYLSTEIDSLSRRHQRSLLDHFDEVQLKVQRLNVPTDTKDAWWADSMVVVRAIK